MSSAICQNFVQNAWKKELCSNCFKSKDEHIKRKTTQTKYEYNASKSAKNGGIIKTTLSKTNNKSKLKRNVNFRSELTQVIGYGGEDWPSDEEEPPSETTGLEEGSSSSSSDDEEMPNCELFRLTKFNTDYNTSSLISAISDTKKSSYAQLKLGQPKFDSEGKKLGILVSVTPFGEDTTQHKKVTSSKTSNNSHIPVIAKNNKELVIDSSKNIVLTSYTSKSGDKEEKTLLEEITETLENGKNPIQIISRKKTQKELVLENPAADKKVVVVEEKVANKSTSSIPERKNGLSRNVLIKRDEKPTVVTKIEMYNSSLNSSKSVYKSTTSCKEIELSSTDDSNTSSGDETSLESEKEVPIRNFSREQVGEPDGKADSDNNSTELSSAPSLPTSPPPVLMDSQNSSFLHSAEKPKVPSKPATILIRKNINQNLNQELTSCQQVLLTTFSTSSETLSKVGLYKQDSTGSDVGKNGNNKRRAPKPPPSQDDDHHHSIVSSTPTLGIYTKSKSVSAAVGDCPVVRELEKRERASSCSPKFRNGSGNGNVAVSDHPQGECNAGRNGATGESNGSNLPEAAPRKLLSVSTDSLNGGGSGELKKEKRGRFSLKKFLRISSSTKDLNKTSLEIFRSEQDLRPNTTSGATSPSTRPQPKPRLEIVHPSDLNGSSVEVLNKDHQLDSKPTMQSTMSSTMLSSNPDNMQIYLPRVQIKPSPPPRNHGNNASSIEDSAGNLKSKPGLPHPPKSAEIIHKLKQLSVASGNSKPRKVEASSVYANIGEVRSSITPNKPQRTASMREREQAAQALSHFSNHNNNNNNKSTNNYSSKANLSAGGINNGYEYIIIGQNNNNSKSCSNNVNNNNSNRSSSPEDGSTSGSTSSNSSNSLGVATTTGSSSSKLGGGVASTEVVVLRNSDSGGGNHHGHDYYKMNSSSGYQQQVGAGHQIPRSVSLTYCGSETESEIYAPYSCYYGSESEIAEDENDWNNSTGRTHKLRSRKGRSIVHKNLEDNYGAVVVANHEALAQVLENIQHNSFIPATLRGLKSSPNLRWSDFTLSASPPASTSGSDVTVTVGRRTFRPATWSGHPVTLAISAGSIASSSLAPSLANLALQPITEFSDLVPSSVVVGVSCGDGDKKPSATSMNKNGNDCEEFGLYKEESYVQATVTVLPLLQVTTMQSYGAMLPCKGSATSPSNNGRAEDLSRDAIFVLLQLVNALKTLQAQGIEELPLSLDTFVLCKDADKDLYYRLCVLQGLSEDSADCTTRRRCHDDNDNNDTGNSVADDDAEATLYASLCSCAASALSLVVRATVPSSSTGGGKLAPLLHRLLNTERAVCLTQVRSVLEFCLWGPSDVALGNTIRDRELALQRWLDLQRATVLHGLVCTKVQLTVYEECHLLFLVRSNAKMMCDASLLLESVSATTANKT